MRGYIPQSNHTRDSYAVAAVIDGQIHVTQVEGLDFTAILAAVAAYKNLTGRENELHINPSIFRMVPNFHPGDKTGNNDKWTRFQVADPIAGPQEIAVLLTGSRPL